MKYNWYKKYNYIQNPFMFPFTERYYAIFVTTRETICLNSEKIWAIGHDFSMNSIDSFHLKKKSTVWRLSHLASHETCSLRKDLKRLIDDLWFMVIDKMIYCLFVIIILNYLKKGFSSLKKKMVQKIIPLLLFFFKYHYYTKLGTSLNFI